MVEKKRKKRGRKRLLKDNKKHLIQVFVKAKHYAAAKKTIQKVAGEYNTEENKVAV